MTTTDKTIRWTWRDTLGCLLVPLLTALTGSWMLSLWTQPHYYLSEYNSISFGTSFCISFGCLLAIFLAYRLTLFQRRAEGTPSWWKQHKIFAGFLITVGFYLLGAVVIGSHTTTALALPDLSQLDPSSLSLHTLIQFLPIAIGGCLIAVYLLSFAIFSSLFRTLRHAGRVEKALLPFSRKRQAFGLALVVHLSALPWVAVGEFWKRGSDRSQCIMHIRNVQQATRSYQGMNGHHSGTEGPFNEGILLQHGFLQASPACPAGGTYTWIENRFPETGELTIRCNCEGHKPKSHTDW